MVLIFWKKEKWRDFDRIKDRAQKSEPCLGERKNYIIMCYIIIYYLVGDGFKPSPTFVDLNIIL